MTNRAQIRLQRRLRQASRLETAAPTVHRTSAPRTAARPAPGVPSSSLTISAERAAELPKVYDNYINHMETVYNTVYNASLGFFATLAESLSGTTSALPRKYEDLLSQYWYPLAKAQNALQLPPKMARTALEPLRFSVSINYRGLPASSLSDESNPYWRFQRALRTWLPEFALPTDYTNAGSEMQPVWPEGLSVTTSLEKLVSKIGSLPANSQYDPNFEYDEGYQERFRGFVDLTVAVDLSTMEFRPPLLQSATSSGSLLGTDAYLTFDVVLRAGFNWPKEYAMWVTDCETEAEFNPVNFLWLSNRNSNYYANRSGDAAEPPTRMGSLSKIAQRNAARNQTMARKLKPRTRDDFSILRSGRVVWVPAVNKVVQFEAGQRSLYDAANGRIDSDTASLKLGNQPIYDDWLYNTFTYSNGNGDLESIDLNGAIPLDDVTLHRVLNFKFTSDYYMSIVELYAKVAQQVTTAAWLKAVDPSFGAVHTGLEKIMNYFKAYAPDATFVQIMTADLAGLESAAPAEATRYTATCNYVGALLRECDSQRTVGFALSNRIRLLEFFHYLLANVPNAKALATTASEKRLQNAPPQWTDAGAPRKPIELYNLPGVEFVLPHQNEVLQTTARLPDNVVYDIDPGGGKTVIIAMDIVLNIVARKAVRPIVLVPGGLVKDMVTELQRFSRGQLNIFPLRAGVVRKLKSQLGWNQQKITQYIRSMPPNTVLVTDMNFVGSRRNIDDGKVNDTIYYGTTTAQFYPVMDFLLDLEPDVLYIDESHKVKNLDSQRTMAAGNLAATMPRHRLSSGTLISNAADDLVGQASMINPNILGTKQTFSENVYVDGDPRKGLVPGAANIINTLMRPYTARVVKKRREWAFLLPAHINERFWPVDLTVNQKRFYDRFMEDTVAEVMSDAELVKMMRSGDEKFAARIEQALKRYFSKVEIFLNAPDANDAYMNSGGLSRADKISPKSAIVDQIITYHRTGGVLRTPGSDGVTFKASKHKVIVFGYNKAVADHLYRNSIHQKVALVYHAGDEEVITRFKNDPSISVLFADEESLKEGFNFQFADMMIRLQTLWSPGGQNQSISRVMRPDVPNLYGRTTIDYEWILVNQSLEIAKCVAGDSMIATRERGIVRIDQVATGREQSVALTVGSRYQPEVTEGWIFNGRQRTVEVETEDGYSVTGTAIHRLLAFEPTATNGTDYRFLKDLAYDDWVVINTQPVLRALPLALSAIVADAGRYNTAAITQPQHMTPDLAFVLGGLDSEGFISKNRAGIPSIVGFTNTDQRLATAWTAAFARVFGIRPNLHKFNRKGTTTLGGYTANYDIWDSRIQNIQIGNFLQAIGANVRNSEDCGGEKPAKHKRIPWSVLQADAECQRAYLAAYLEGDGSVSRDVLAWYSYSPGMLKDLRVLLQAHGAFCTWGCSKHVSLRVGYPFADRLLRQLNRHLVSKRVDLRSNVKRAKAYCYWGIPADKIRAWLNSRVVHTHFHPTLMRVLQPLLAGGEVELRAIISQATISGGLISRRLRQLQALGIVQSRNLAGLGSPLAYRLSKKGVKLLAQPAKSRKQGGLTLRADSGELLDAPRSIFYQNTGPCLRYDSYRAGKYTKLLNLIKQISVPVFDSLNKLFAQEYVFSRVSSKRVGKRQPVYDLSMREGVEPSYVVNGIVGHNTARLISKTVQKAMIDEADNPNWRRVQGTLESLNIPLLSMNLDAIRDYQTFGSLENYFAAYQSLKSWEDAEYAEATAQLTRRVTKQLGHPPTDRAELIRAAMVPTVNKGTIPGSKSVYTPWVEGMTPYDAKGYGLQPVSLVENLDDGDEDGTEVQQVDVEEGQSVLTEFGPGRITGILSKSLRVKVGGFGDVTLSKSLVMVPSGKGIKTFETEMKKLGRLGAPTLRKGEMVAQPVPEAPEVEKIKPPRDSAGKPILPKPVQAPKAAAPGTQVTPAKPAAAEKPAAATKVPPVQKKLWVFASTVNNAIALWATYDAQDANVLLSHGFKQFPPYLSAQIKNYGAAAKFVEVLKKNFDVPPDNLKQLAYLANSLRGPRGRLEQTVAPDYSTVKNYWLLGQKPNKYPRTLKIWPMVWDSELYVCATVHTQPQAAAKLRRLQRVPGMAPFELEKNFIIKTYPSSAAAVADLKSINTASPVDDYAEVVAQLRAMRVGKKVV